ncbi:arginine--tRNA ligase [Tepiditoga spiralis]|uniref:Arginine--tRNA ligase n=1 Tax=Tepiditoga spiralis TaxID=2108365 RepID=A0A7G1G5U2_9BACT|nr:arginine--tRNA ligase [Tepiditoga spiralis]BBE31781.1 arginine--tRNA ligase [Tepiditoga spiralis]
MINIKLIENILQEILVETVSKLYGKENAEKLFIQETNNPTFGDYQTNYAMINAKVFKKNPRLIAQEIVDNLEKNDVIEKVEIAGPGFINIFLKKSFIENYVLSTGKEKIDFNRDISGDIVIDYSSPNIAKPMHIGHLRSTVIGDAIKRIYTFVGYNVIGDNHLGDWGTQFGKLIVAYERWLDKENYEKNPINELERIYVEFEKKSAENPELLDIARAELKKLQDGDEKNRKLWKEFIDVSMSEYNKIYDRMYIKFDTYYGESFYHDKMGKIIELLKEKNIAEKDQGALVVKFPEESHIPVALVQKSDGAFLYTTSDLACIDFRRKKYNVDRLIYVTDDRQQLHFKQVFAITDMLGWDVKKEHVYFGLMRFADGVFSTRKGNVIKLQDLLDRAKEKVLDILKERNPNDENIDEKAEIIAIGAVKYGDLSQNRTSEVIFDWNKTLSFNANSSVYLQYTYARIQSIFRKANIDKLSNNLSLTTEAEEKLAKTLIKFPEAVLRAADAYKPNLLTDYLFDLAQTFNSFYSSTPILKSTDIELNSRLILCEKTAHILKEGLNLLGIKVLNEM